MLIFGGVALLLGVALPFLMVVHVLPSTFLLNFIAYGFSVAGLICGMIGVIWTVRPDLQQRRSHFDD
ncbi:MAG: hypothetical protein D6803_07180 [Anaerolineae bacterium]|nr:MAG: hypothetical protein D6803_07180 [Anaerolineae bacterium]